MFKTRRLKVDELILIGTRVYRVLRVGPGSATVEPAVARHTTFETADGRAVAFDAPAGRMTISPTSEVQRVDPAEVEAMAKKVTEKKAKPSKAGKAEGPMMTFAFRLPPEESKAIHEAAGKGGASKFARAVLVAAARGDLDAIKAVIEAPGA